MKSKYELVVAYLLPKRKIYGNVKFWHNFSGNVLARILTFTISKAPKKHASDIHEENFHTQVQVEMIKYFTFAHIRWCEWVEFKLVQIIIIVSEANLRLIKSGRLDRFTWNSPITAYIILNIKRRYRMAIAKVTFLILKYKVWKSGKCWGRELTN